MPTDVRSSRWSQTVAWIVASLFLLGFFVPLLGFWTGPILGVWFVGDTKAPARIFLADGLRLHSWPDRRLAQVPADRTAADAGIPCLGSLRLFPQRASPGLPPTDQPAFAGIALHTPVSACCGRASVPASASAAHCRNLEILPACLPHQLVCGDDRLDVEPGVSRRQNRPRRKHLWRNLSGCGLLRPLPLFHRSRSPLDLAPRRRLSMGLPCRNCSARRLGGSPPRQIPDLGRPARGGLPSCKAPFPTALCMW